MKRLRPLDRVLLALLVPLWAVCFALSARSALRPTGIPPVYVSARADAESYPTVAGFRPDLSVQESEIHVGDRLLRLGGADLRGVGALGLFVRVAEAAGPDGRVALVFERAGAARETPLAVGAYSYFVWPMLPVSLVCTLTAVLLLFRAPASPMVRAVFQAFMCAAITYAGVFGGSRPETYASIVINNTTMVLLIPLIVRALLLFPHDVPPTGGWGRFGPWLFVVFGPMGASALYGVPFAPDVGLVGHFAVGSVACATCLLVMTQAYRRADPIGRRQLKWFMFGLYGALVPAAVAAAVAAYDPRFTPAAFAAQSAQMLVPICLLIAIARYNLFDIDRLISGAASYNVLLVVLVGAGLVVVPRSAAAAAGLIGIDRSTGQALISLLLAAALVPAHRALRPQIDRVFFSERYALDRGIERLLRELSARNDPPALIRRTGESLERLLGPDACVVYARAEQSYIPVFVEGRAAPSGFAPDSPLIAVLRQRRGLLTLRDLPRRRDAQRLGPFDRAALETLDAAIVLPLWRRDDLLAFLCLGRKRSGDVYTPTDVALLAVVADKVSSGLLRFDDADIIRDGRAMEEALRRYVPGPVAAQLASGRELQSGERMVSVLFVDIRGYTSYAETRTAQAIFSMVNRYTDAISRIVNKRGGTIAEFTGDGVMAVFGAPEPLARKEQAAVEAGREIVTAVLSLGGEPDGPPLTVGVGIATGEAFVGPVQAVDRLIWTAIGNTTNLAARLQSLTRELEADIVIDAATWLAAGEAGADFQRREKTPIRGRRQSEDVYLLPLEAPSAQTGQPRTLGS